MLDYFRVPARIDFIGLFGTKRNISTHRFSDTPSVTIRQLILTDPLAADNLFQEIS
jgi:hypothetical protein